MNQLIGQRRSVGYGVNLQGDEIALDYVAADDPDEAVVLPLIEEVKTNKANLIRSLKMEALVVANIGHAIGRARDWHDLSVIWPHMDMVFTIGNLTAAEHDSLVSRLKARSKALPEVAAIGHTIEKG